MNYNEGTKIMKIGAIVIFLLVFLSGCSLWKRDSQPTVVAEKETAMARNVWRSTDKGENWELKNVVKGKVNASNPDILNIEFDPGDSNHIFVALRKGGILETKDGSETWRFVDFATEKIYGFQIDPTNPKRFYVSGVLKGRGKIFKSEDEGANWKEIYTFSADGPLVVSLTLDHNNPQILYVGTSDNQVIKSEDGGRSWKNIFRSDAPIISIKLDQINNRLVYFLSNNGKVYRSFNQGNNLEEITSKIPQMSSSDQVLEVDPSHTQWLYVAGKGGLRKSNNAGDNWIELNTLQYSATYPITALAVNPKNSNEMIYGAVQATYKTVNGGETWTTYQFNVSTRISAIRYKPDNSDIMYLVFR